jgi:hypothetical protein
MHKVLTVVGGLLAVEERGHSLAPVIDVTRDKLLKRREELLEHLGMTLDEFSELASTRTLSGDEWEAMEELDGIAFLLGDDDE